MHDHRHTCSHHSLEIELIKAKAAASDAPFKNAFKATLGVAAAQALLLAIVFGVIVLTFKFVF